jgi:hypothetical protein
MKFEHILQIYWSKGFLTNGKLQKFTTNFRDMFVLPGGFAWPTKNLLISRFEAYKLLRNPNKPIDNVTPFFVQSVNIMFSKITSVNSTTLELTRGMLLRLYLIKTTRGRSHALGKPSRGQRTWSNAWSAYNVGNETRAFISAYQKIINKNRKIEKINYRLMKRKSLRKKKKDAVSKVKIRINNWF